ncbi:hypothetical protein M422DRAFT_28219 [Sphaerobolus stellatus SS14]|nr:hypothetical protein M422DRAFT_28219 [Sphaerobolus stellatus SS14]
MSYDINGLDILTVGRKHYSQRIEQLKHLLRILPPEITEHIFIVSALESQSQASNLCLVSKSLRRLLTPILYNTIQLTAYFQNVPFFKNVRLNVELSKYVKNIYISDNVGIFEPGVDQRILAMCSNIKRVVFEVSQQPAQKLIPAAKWPRPWEFILICQGHVTIQLGDFLVHAILRNVTHLFLGINFTNIEVNPEILFEAFTQLSHLGLFCPRNSPSLSLIIPHCLSLASLEMLLLISDATRWEYPDHFTGPTWDIILSLALEDKRIIGRPTIEEGEFMRLLKAGKTIWEDARECYADWRERSERGLPAWMTLPTGGRWLGND